jgi:hypothetical protein
MNLTKHDLQTIYWLAYVVINQPTVTLHTGVNKTLGQNLQKLGFASVTSFRYVCSLVVAPKGVAFIHELNRLQRSTPNNRGLSQDDFLLELAKLIA